MTAHLWTLKAHDTWIGDVLYLGRSVGSYVVKDGQVEWSFISSLRRPSKSTLRRLAKLIRSWS